MWVVEIPENLSSWGHKSYLVIFIYNFQHQHQSFPSTSVTSTIMTLSQYDYIFAIGTFFALLDAFNNGASKFKR